MKLEEPCEARVSSTVPWECKGETPLRDPIISHFKNDQIETAHYYIYHFRSN